MRYLPFHLSKSLSLIVVSSVCFTANAQETIAATPAPTANNNLLAILLIITAAVLAFVIWGMGQVLVVLTRQMLDKSKAGKGITTVATTLLLLATSGVFAQEVGTGKVAESVPNYGGLSANTFYCLVAVLSIEIIIIFFMAFFIRKIFKELVPEKAAAVVQTSKLAAWWTRMDKKVFTQAVPIEKEADFLLDHDYDGIRELDNALPPWWKYGFYVTIAVALVYLFNFHVMGSGKNPSEEYIAEMEKAAVDKEAYEAKNKDKVDEAHVPMADATGIATGKEYYVANCVACHGDHAQGNVGPNLTDDYWLHKGSLNDIFQTIKNGYPNKGMAAWSNKFNPKEMSYIASYIKSLKGSNPANPKPPQGDLFIETASGTSKDSVTASTAITLAQPNSKADSTIAVKK